MATEIKSQGIDSNYRTDQQKSGDRTGLTDSAGSGSSTRRDFADKGSDIADDIAHKAKQAGETLKDKADDFGHSMQETGHNIAEKTKHGHKAVCDFTRDNPTAAILIAFGVGAILARVLPKW